jgi:hypothetical protein
VQVRGKCRVGAMATNGARRSCSIPTTRHSGRGSRVLGAVMITRPALDEVYAYRAHVDQAVASLLCSRPSREVAELIELGCHHERQHQELLLTDILHLFAQNPIRPAYRDPAPVSGETAVLPALSFTDFEGGESARPATTEWASRSTARDHVTAC